MHTWSAESSYAGSSQLPPHRSQCFLRPDARHTVLAWYLWPQPRLSQYRHPLHTHSPHSHLFIPHPCCPCRHPIAGIQWNPVPLYPPGFWGPRPMLASNMLLKAQQWLASAHPYWNRTGGRDHIWLMSHDEGACYAPISIWNSTILSHWGRLERNHSSSSGYGPDNYDVDPIHYLLQPKGWTSRSSKAHACYDPHKVRASVCAARAMCVLVCLQWGALCCAVLQASPRRQRDGLVRDVSVV